MEGWMVLRRWLFKPLPLSCLLHLGGILLLAFWLSHSPALPEDLPEAEVVMEMPPEELLPDEDPVPDQKPEAPDEEVPAPDAGGSVAKQSEPAPLLSSMAASLAGQPKGAAAQAAILPAADASSAPDNRSASHRPAAEQHAAADEAPVARADGIPAAATKGHPAAGPSSGVQGETAGPGKAGAPSGSSGTADGTSGNGAAARNGTGAEDGAGAASSGHAESTADIAARFAARVEAHKEYPYSAVKRQQQGSVTTSVTLSADGSLLSASVIASSGVSSLDESALAAVRASCPFEHGAGHSITLEVTTYFDLQE